MKMKKLYFLLGLVLLFTACEVEFSPNAEWKNVPVVYCLLDQDDDTTWVRVQRCYLSDENVYSFGSVSDSINYPQGSISVTLLAYDGETLKDSMDFEYVVRDHDGGNFASQSQPLYRCFTQGRLKENYRYKLMVRNADGTVLASSELISLIKKPEGDIFRKPTLTSLPDGRTMGQFGFYDQNAGSTEYCRIEWAPFENARLYQPKVRFYYEEQGERKYVDVLCQKVKSGNGNSSIGIFYPRYTFLEDLKAKLVDDTCRKVYLKYVDLYVTSCSEDMNAYLATAVSGGTLGQEVELYSNINGGIGVFAARRTHVCKRFPADSSLLDNRGLFYFLENLGVNVH